MLFLLHASMLMGYSRGQNDLRHAISLYGFLIVLQTMGRIHVHAFSSRYSQALGR